MDQSALTAGAARQLYLFRKSLPQRIRFQEIARALGPLEKLVCLEFGGESGAISHHLRKAGGEWTTVAADAATAAAVRQVIAEPVAVYGEPPFPFDKKTFDAAVVVDSLERIADDARFIEECHKALKPDGRLVLNVARIKPWSLIGFLRGLLGMTPDRAGFVREGYTETDLFNVLKDGFDVLSMRSYSKFCIEFVDLLVKAVERRLAGAGGDSAGARRLYQCAVPFYWLANQVDLLLFFHRGFRMIAVAKRRAWRPRKTPVLVDGRSITEAVLSRAAN